HESHYSQPKLELFGLFRALQSWRLYLVGVQNLIVEVDAKYIKGMLNEPDLQPNATINRWIQGIFLFDLKLVHVPATRFKGPDALSHRPTDPDYPEAIADDDDSWLDDIALLTFISDGRVLAFTDSTENLPYLSSSLPSVFITRELQDTLLSEVMNFLQSTNIP
ncbi:hypothetical protein FISHEDRAFT_11834, partial [Fistulina hepatica ATCC 64428]